MLTKRRGACLRGIYICLDGQLVSERGGYLGEFQRVGPRETADAGGIAGGVDVGVVVAGDGFEGVGGGVPHLVEAGVVRASVAALFIREIVSPLVP